MGKRKTAIFVFGVMFLVLWLFMSIPVYGTEEDNFSATLTDYDGEVLIQKPGEEEVLIQKPGEEAWLLVEKDMPLEQSDRIRTGSFAFAEILIDDGSLVTVEQNSEITLSELSADVGTKKIESTIFLAFGRLISNVARFMHRDSRYSVQTPTMVAGVRGTEFVVEATDSEKTDVGVFEGEVAVGCVDYDGKLIKESEVLVAHGNQTSVQRYKRPLRPFALKKEMLLHKKRVLLLRKKAIERRRDLPKIVHRRLKVHKETLKKWNRTKQERLKIKREIIKRKKHQKRTKGKLPPPRPRR
ncbi:MAG: FecR domain-containing protein [Deltaproteobacteria bacterium]|nr:FecR domain-containing protein [Deltaproteobacteria bacterium]